MILLKDAQSLMLTHTVAIREVEEIPLHLANGRSLAIDLIAPFSQPPFTNSGMDGFALSSEGTQSASPESPLRFPVKGYQFAGSQPGNPDRESAAEIATGAPLPAGKDAVLTKEESQIEGGYLKVIRPVAKGENVRWQGEDVATGARLLQTGTKIETKHLGMLASFGFHTLPVVRRPKIYYLATGSELVRLGEERKEYQIYNSNALSLYSLCETEKVLFVDTGICEDEQGEMVERIKSIFEFDADIMILNGGVSVGKRDYVREAILQVGGEILFHKVAIKPGKPLLFAKRANTLIFGIPGNPVATQVSFFLFLYPVLRKLLHSEEYFSPKEEAFLAESVKLGSKEIFLRGIRHQQEGITWVFPLRDGSGSIASFARGDCLIDLPIGDRVMERGEKIEIVPYSRGS